MNDVIYFYKHHYQQLPCLYTQHCSPEIIHLDVISTFAHFKILPVRVYKGVGGSRHHHDKPTSTSYTATVAWITFYDAAPPPRTTCFYKSRPFSYLAWHPLFPLSEDKYITIDQACWWQRREQLWGNATAEVDSRWRRTSWW